MGVSDDVAGWELRKSWNIFVESRRQSNPKQSVLRFSSNLKSDRAPLKETSEFMGNVVLICYKQNHCNNAEGWGSGEHSTAVLCVKWKNMKAAECVDDGPLIV